MNNVHEIRDTLHDSRFTKFSSTTVEDSLQITCFYAKQTQFTKKSNDVNPYNITDYEGKRDWTLGENKPNSNPNKPNLRRAKMNVNLYVIEDYRKKDDFLVRINKPNCRKGKKLMQSVYLQRIMKNNTDMGSKKTKPIQSQFKAN